MIGASGAVNGTTVTRRALAVEAVLGGDEGSMGARRIRRRKLRLTRIYDVYTLKNADVRYVFRGLLFEWDEAKARMNLKKHGVSRDLL